MRRILFIGREDANASNILNGVAAFAENQRDLSIRAVSYDDPRILDHVKQFNPDAFLSVPIMHLPAQLRDWIKQNGKPLVVMGHQDSGDLVVGFDEPAIGRLAAEYFLNRGFNHFAYVGGYTNKALQWRYQGYKERIETAGFRCHFSDEMTSLSPWLTDLAPHTFEVMCKEMQTWPMPCAVFCSSERAAYGLTELCRQMKLAIPEQIAVLAAGDEQMLGRAVPVPISAVPLDYFQLGFKAAELIQKLCNTESRKPEHIIIRPGKIVSRASSNIIAANNPVVVHAVRFISENVHRPVKVAELLEITHVSRSKLEREFRSALNRTPQQEIHRQKINLARELLSTSTASIASVANSCGFDDQFQFSGFFKSKTGLSPLAFRKNAGKSGFE